MPSGKMSASLPAPYSIRSMLLPTFDPMPSAEAVGVGAFGQIDVDVRVMHGARRVRDDLHPLDVAIFGELRIDDLFGNEVRALGGNLEALLHADDQIGLAVGPLGGRGEDPRRRRVGAPALGRAAIDPRADRRDLLHRTATGRRGIRRCCDRCATAASRARDLLLDRARPRPHLLVGHQRHRRGRARMMALLTGPLEDRQDVLGERGGWLTGGRRSAALRLHGRAGRTAAARGERQPRQARTATGTIRPPALRVREIGLLYTRHGHVANEERRTKNRRNGRTADTDWNVRERRRGRRSVRRSAFPLVLRSRSSFRLVLRSSARPASARRSGTSRSTRSMTAF